MPHYVFIHGANSSSDSFNYIISNIKPKNSTIIDYDSANGFFPNLEMMANKIPKDKKIFLVSHSLGGIYSVHLTNIFNVVGAVSISTPYSGSSLADWARFMIPNYQLFRDVGTKSQPIITAQDIKITIPWIQLVSTKGRVPWMVPDNDGVVTIQSQKSRTDMTHIPLPYNHYDIMCSPEVVKNN